MGCGLVADKGFFCTIQVEDSSHHCIQCPIARQIWAYIPKNLGSFVTLLFDAKTLSVRTIHT